MRLEDLKFNPQIKEKRFKYDRGKFKPFPTGKTNAVFTGFSVEISEKASIIELYESGFYGKGSHSRSAPEVIRKSKEPVVAKPREVLESLVLDLEEAFFLSHILGSLNIFNIQGEPLSSTDLLQKFCAIKKDFPITFAAYLYLKSKNWVVKAGSKFGGDFLLYKSGPRFHHASFVVHVTSGKKMPIKDFQGIHRVAGSSDKDVLILEVSPPQSTQTTETQDLLHQWGKYTVSECIAKRLDFKEFVQVKS